MDSFGAFEEEGEDLEDMEGDEEMEDTEEDKAHQNKLKEVVETLRSKRAMSAQRPSTIVHVNTGALEVTNPLPALLPTPSHLVSWTPSSDSFKTNEEAAPKT